MDHFFSILVILVRFNNCISCFALFFWQLYKQYHSGNLVVNREEK